MSITTTELQAFEGKSIAEICTVGYSSTDLNHCAHFVSHALKLSFGITCRMMKSGGPKDAPSATIRVHELFSRCSKVGLWDEEPSTIVPCLIFITKEANVDMIAKRMENVPKKHVGVAIGKLVWHYSNSKDKVVQVTDEQFRKHYTGSGYALFYGDIPQ